MKERIQLGKLFLTRRIMEASINLPAFNSFLHQSLSRHANGDWGDICEEDKASNNDAVKHGYSNILSAYSLPTIIEGIPDKIWIITERDHSCTTILFPDEY